MFDLNFPPDQFELILRDIRHTAQSANKYPGFERYLAELFDIDPERVYTAYISKPGNFDVRMSQSDRARKARLHVALVPNARDVADIKSLSRRLAIEKNPGTSAMIVYDDDGKWLPVWGIEPDIPGSVSYLARLSVDYDNFQVETYTASTYESMSPQQKAEILKALIETGPIEPWIDILGAEPRAIQSMYRLNPAIFTRPIEQDDEANDVIAIAHRREVIRRFIRLLEDEDFFQENVDRFSSQKYQEEAVWQELLEENPWILGVSLAGQMLTGWSEERLEQVVAGFSVAGPGKRADALMRTNGRIRALVFAEIKTPKTRLLGGEYRPGCYSPSSALSGAVTQVQQTLHYATRQIGSKLAEKDAEGADTGESTYLVRPRSYLIVGNLEELRGSSGVHQQKYESFELYRRNLYEPEIITFDELLARAEWHVQALGGER